MSRSKAASAARQPTAQEQGVVHASPTPDCEQEFKTIWQGGNPFERLELAPKVEKARRR